ncbi:TPA: hypothetical protein N2D99_002076 [Clostridium botulinum]|nr:hypothetical protein [Clostridium botulinum]
MEYICDKCKETIEVNKEIKCCPMCGTNCIRDTGKPMKQLIVAQCSVVGRVKFVQHPDGHKEFVDFLNGDKTIEIIGEEECSYEIDEVEYNKL